jgi:hypothetical protein
MEEENTNAAEPVKSLLIMAEVQALIIRTHSTCYSPPKPGDDSSTPLLNDTEAQHETGVPGQQPAKFERIRDVPFTVWLKLFVTLAPLFIMASSWAVLSSTGVDPLAFGMLAFILTLALIVYIVVVCPTFLHNTISPTSLSILNRMPSKF